MIKRWLAGWRLRSRQAYERSWNEVHRTLVRNWLQAVECGRHDEAEYWRKRANEWWNSWDGK